MLVQFVKISFHLLLNLSQNDEHWMADNQNQQTCEGNLVVSWLSLEQNIWLKL